MSLENLISDAVERGVLAAMAKINAVSTAPVVTVVEQATPPKKPGRPKKIETVTEDTPAVTDTPLPPPAPAPAVAQVDDIEADRAKLIVLTGQIENGRKCATELIRKHGTKFDALSASIRKAILAELESMVLA